LKTVSVAAFGVSLCLVVAWIHWRSVRRLQHEIDELG
jgi:hypothetical protein